MPQYCNGFQDSTGSATAAYIFAHDGKGGPANIKKNRDGDCCPFCSATALHRALNFRIGKGHLTIKLARWRERCSPAYEALFSMGSWASLSQAQQLCLRTNAGERARFIKATSWLRKKKTRLQHLLLGRPPRAARKLTKASEYFLRARRYYQRPDHPRTSCKWVKLLHKYVAAIPRHRQGADKHPAMDPCRGLVKLDFWARPSRTAVRSRWVYLAPAALADPKPETLNPKP